jgi:hypothetical protein
MTEDQKMLGAQAILVKQILESQHPTNVLSDDKIKEITGKRDGV